MLGLGSSLAKGGASLLTFVKDNLKLYLDFKSTKSNTLKFPSEGSTSFAYTDKIMFSQQTFTGAFSVVCWFNGDVNTPYKRLFGDSSPPSGTNDILVKDVSGQVSIRINGNYKANINNVPNNTWSHLAFTRDDNGNIKSYLNGVQSTTSTSTDTFTLDNIGGDGGGAVMSMCNAGLWSRELSPEEIQSIMNKSYSQLKGVEKTSLVAWWALDADSLSEQVFTDTTWATQGSSQTATHNGNFNFTVTNDGTGTQSYRPSIDFPTTAGKTYKMTLTPTSKTGTINALFHNGFNTGGGYQGDFSFDGNSTIVYYYTGFNGGFLSLNGTTGAWSITFDILVQETNYQLDSKGTNHGSTFGATINSNVYGGNAPILPRAIDVAKQGFADPIGNGSASFDGSSDRISFSPLSITGDASFTISAWIKPNTILGGNTVVVFGDDDTTDSAKRVALYFNAGKPYFAFWGSDVLHNSSVIQANEWQHFAITYSGGNTTTANSAIYLNGVSLSLTGGTASPLLLENDIFQIGADHNPSQYFDGLISQVGIWRGALTQSQLQSVLESTSYSKIPADVKSTLGSELFDADASTFDSGTHSWVVYGSNTVANDSGALKITYVNDARGAYLWLKDASDLSSNLTIGKTYKFTFDAKVSSGASVDVTISTLSGSPQVITETSFTTKSIYFTAENTTTTYIDTRNMGSGEIIYLDNLSLKEVINDIVAYYPLDGDSSRGNGTDDVTTGEVLGSELFTNGWTNDGNGSSYPPYSGSFSYDASANTVTATSGSSGTFVGNETFRTEFTAVANALYKITFTTSNTVSSVQLRGLSSANHLDTQASTPYLAQSSLGDGNQVFYLKANASATRYIGFRSGGTNRSITVSNFSIKQVTSNTGVLL